MAEIKKSFKLGYWKLGTNAKNYIDESIIRSIECIEKKEINLISNNRDTYEIKIHECPNYPDNFGMFLTAPDNEEINLFPTRDPNRPENKDKKQKELGNSKKTWGQICNVLYCFGIIEQIKQNSEYVFSKEVEQILINKSNQENDFYDFLYNNFIQNFKDYYLSDVSDKSKKSFKENASKSFLFTIFFELVRKFKEYDDEVIGGFYNNLKNYLGNDDLADEIMSIEENYWEDIVNKLAHNKMDDKKAQIASLVEEFKNILSNSITNYDAENEDFENQKTSKKNNQKDNFINFIDKNEISTGIHKKTLDDYKYKPIKEVKGQIFSVMTEIFDLIFNRIFKNKFNIPIYQRNYVWSQELINRLMIDINSKIDSEYDEYHFLGNIVLCSKHIRDENDDNKSHQYIVDGQQRIITSILILNVIFKYYLQNDWEAPKELFKIFENTNTGKVEILNHFQDDISDTESYKYLNNLLSGKGVDAKNKKRLYDDVVIYRNANCIYTWLKDKIAQKEDQKAYLDSFLKTFVTKFIINVCYLELKDEFIYYEKINLLTKPLNDIDLIKSFLYAELNKHYGIKFKKSHSNNIYKFLDFFVTKKGDGVKTEFEKVIKLFAFNNLDWAKFNEIDTKIQSKSRITKTYTFFEAVIKQKIKDANPSIEEFIKWVKFEISKCYYVLGENESWNLMEDFNITSDWEEEKVKSLRLLLPHITTWTNQGDLTDVTPAILAILEKGNLFDGKIIDEKIKHAEKIINNIYPLLFEIERFTFFWKLDELFRGNSLGDKFIRLGYAIKNNEINTSLEIKDRLKDFSAPIKKFLNNTEDKVINDKKLEDEFREILKKQFIQNTEMGSEVNKKKLKTLLRIEWFLLNDEKHLVSVLTNLQQYKNISNEASYEHMAATNGNDDVSMESKQMIGNGVIYHKRLNSSDSNHRFTVKKRSYTKDPILSKLKIYSLDTNSNYESKDIYPSQWEDIDDNKILRRSEWLIDILIRMYLKK
ncbi:DUF262 domain-containing protein [Mycoplasma sp. Pen4]|uniref:DUF262 domain-containing protein n=1 Tax=Mycoplasma sp. Pen4 TaxID=640330 RepID=UPI00165499BF|nr:DUF262 domain-containing protein [Mycoplasma sp. Pen4]QNM93787.1 DUF262 domain-containing protein [Mycoplasma sp. Pen4]